MKCKKCGNEIAGLKKRYFSNKLCCPVCNVLVSTWEMDWGDYWIDLMMLLGFVRDGNRGRF